MIKCGVRPSISLSAPGKSSAQSIAQKLNAAGLERAEFRADLIKRVYEGLNPWAHPPDFRSITKILAGLECAEDSESNQLIGIIVETRRHNALPFVVNNFFNRIRAPIQLFHGRDNLEFIHSTSLAELIEAGNVLLTELGTDKLNQQMYNGLFLSPRFWRSIRGRGKILVFQSDSISCANSPYDIGDFLSFDYIGSKWHRERPVGLVMDGGNGGLSLRDWTMSVECLNRFSPEFWPGGEDGYFAFHIDLIGGKVGRSEDCARFSTQGQFLDLSWGAHKIACLDSMSRSRFLLYSEESRFLLENRWLP